MNKKTILITGGTGYIASHTCLEVIKAGYSVVLTDNLSKSSIKTLYALNKILNKEIIFEKGDLIDFRFVKKLFKKYTFDAVIHFAAFKSVKESVDFPLMYYRNNLNSLNNLLDEMLKQNVKNFVYSSSCTVYGLPETLPIDETEPLKQGENPYARSKQMAEQIIIDTSKKNLLKSIILRYFNPIGSHHSGLIGDNPKGIPENLIPFITRTAKGEMEKVTIFGGDYPTKDGTCIRDYIHIMDLANAHTLALKRLFNSKFQQNFETYNLGSEKGYSVLEVIKEFEKVNKIKVNYQIGPRREGDLPEIYANSDKSKKVLGWKIKYNLKDMLSSAWKWEKMRK